MRVLAEVVAKYQKESQRPGNMGYSPLQCAIFEGDEEDVNALIHYYESSDNNALLHELQFTSTGLTKEHVLQIAMKHPPIFELCCKAIEKTDTQLFNDLLFREDSDGDTLFHKMAVFGRIESLDIFQFYLEKYVDVTHMQQALALTNKKGETARDIAENYDDTATITSLKADAVPTEAQMEVARKNQYRILEKFSELGIRTVQPINGQKESLS